MGQGVNSPTVIGNIDGLNGNRLSSGLSGIAGVPRSQITRQHISDRSLPW